MDGLDALPAFAAWRLHGAHDGFEVAHFEPATGGVMLRGTSVGVEDGQPWELRYRIEVDAGWRFRTADIRIPGRRLTIERSDDGWRIDGTPRADLDDVTDIDLEG